MEEQERARERDRNIHVSLTATDLPLVWLAYVEAHQSLVSVGQVGSMNEYLKHCLKTHNTHYIHKQSRVTI